MTEITTEHSVSDVANEIQRMMRDNGMDVTKKRGRGSHGERVITVDEFRGQNKVKIKELDESRSKVDLSLASNRVTDLVEQKFGGGMGVGSSGGGIEREGTSYRRDDDEEEHRRRRRDNGDRRRSRSGSRSSAGKSMGLMDIHSDGSVTMMPPFTKDEADYMPGGSREEPNCKDCVHFLEGGGCSLVQGEIDRNAHCERFYADIGLFGENKRREGLNLRLWGEAYDFDQFDIDQFIRMAEEAMEEKSDENNSL